jgi:hypothetical protein
VELIDGHGDRLPAATHYVGSWFAGLKSNLAAHGSVRRTLLNGNIFMTTSNLIFGRACFDCVGPFEDLRYTHDYEWLLRAIDLGRRVHFEVDERTLRYRMHGKNTILEHPLRANQETFDLLMRYHHLLLAEPSRELSREYTDHVRRIVAYIEQADRPAAQPASITRRIDRALKRLASRVKRV